MMPRSDINSEAYWNQRFAGDWQANAGADQTSFFARLALSRSPRWFLEDLRARCLSICDWGCAMGQAVDTLAAALPQNAILGYDVSETGIAEGRRLFPALDLRAGDLLAGAEAFDVVFSSNTLEHFLDPLAVLTRLAAHARDYVWLLLPFYDPGGIEEHFARFTYENLPPTIAGRFTLVFGEDVDVSSWPGSLWGGRQVVLLYAANNVLSHVARMAGSASFAEAHGDGGATEARAVAWLRQGAVGEAVGPIRAEAQRNAALAERMGAEIERLAAEAEELRRHLDGANTAIATIRAQLEAERAASAEALRKSAALLAEGEDRYRILLASTSWRMTAPLRRLVTAVRDWLGK